jgi:hypothetical protein
LLPRFPPAYDPRPPLFTSVLVPVLPRHMCFAHRPTRPASTPPHSTNAGLRSRVLRLLARRQRRPPCQPRGGARHLRRRPACLAGRQGGRVNAGGLRRRPAGRGAGARPACRDRWAWGGDAAHARWAPAHRISAAPPLALSLYPPFCMRSTSIARCASASTGAYRRGSGARRGRRGQAPPA